MLCLACGKNMPEGQQRCPRCDFMHYASMTDDPEAYRATMAPFAQMHRADFLGKLDLGVNVHYWKDEDGTIVPNGVKRMSLGTAAAMVGKITWLDQEFARIPDVEEITVEISVAKAGGKTTAVAVSVPALKEAQLQLMGLELTEDLKARVWMKNQDSKVSSALVEWIPE